MFFLDMLDLLDFSGVNRSTTGIFDKRVFPDGLPVADVNFIYSEDDVKLFSDNFDDIILSRDVGDRLFDYIYEKHLYFC